MDKLESMQTFVRVAEAGSFVAVANQLQVDRSVVTRQIAALEHALGTKLMTRSTRRLTLTAAGASYLEQCRRILDLVDAAEANLDEDKATPRGRIRMGLPLSFALQSVTPALLDFAQAHPQIDLVMELSDQRANLIEEGLDLSLRITANLQPTDVVRKLGQCRLLTVASPAYLKRHGEPQHPHDLAQHTALIYASDQPNQHWTYRMARQRQKVPVHGRVVANNGGLLAEAAVRGMGIALQPEFILAPYIKRRQLKPILSAYEDTPLGIYAVLPSNRYVPHRVQVLIEHLAHALRS